MTHEAQAKEVVAKFMADAPRSAGEADDAVFDEPIVGTLLARRTRRMQAAASGALL